MSAAIDARRFFMPADGDSGAGLGSGMGLHADSVYGEDDDGDLAMSGVPADSYYASGSGAAERELKGTGALRSQVDRFFRKNDDDDDDGGADGDSAGSGGIGLTASYRRAGIDSDSRVPLYSAHKRGRGDEEDAPMRYGLGVPSAAKKRKMTVGPLPGKARQLPGRAGFTGGGFDIGPFGALRRPGFTGVVTKSVIFGGGIGIKGDINRHAGDIVLEMLSCSAETAHVRGIKGSGRGQPQSQQSPISISIYGNKNQHKERKSNRPEEMVAPIGTPSCHNFEPGEIALCKWTSNRAGAFNIEGYTSWDVTTTVNGVRHDDLYFVAGLIKTAQRLDDSNSSEVSAALFAGTGTTTNEGWKNIFAGDRVLVSLTPNFMHDGEGNPIPTITQEGRPTDKFVPATYPMDEQTVGAQAAAAAFSVDEALDDTFKGVYDSKAGTIKRGAMKFFLDSTSKALEDRYRSRACFGDVHPIRQYGQWYAVSVACGAPLSLLVLTVSSKELQNAMKALLDFIKVAITNRDRNRDIREKNFLVLTDLDESRDTEIRDFSDALKTIPTTPAPEFLLKSGFGKIIARLNAYAVRQMQHCVQEMHFYLRRMTLGTAMNNSAPGHALDVAIKT